MKYKVQLIPSAIEFEASDSSPVLQSALDANVNIAYGCRDGKCGACKARLVSGEVTLPQDLPGLDEQDRAQGYILCCRAVPGSALVLEAACYPELASIRQRIMPCKVDSISYPAPDIAILQLRLPPDSHFSYLPGQYVELVHGTIRRSYSIANCPASYRQGIELHLRNIPGGAMSRFVFGQPKQGTLLYLEGPQGTFFVRAGSGPVIFLAGGTGFAPVKAMVEQLLLDGTRRQLFIYWGNSSVSGFYSDLAQRWQDKHGNISYVPVLSAADGNWNGRRGLVHQAVLEDFGDLSKYEIYACGAPAMIDAARDEFIAMGAKPDTFFFDSFTPST